MTITKIGEVAVLHDEGLLLTDAQSALDLIATVSYETGSDRIAIHKSAVTEEFFDLSTRLAGEILQKFVNFRARLAVIGDFSMYQSKALRDFIRECNRGRHIFFVATEEEAVERLSKA